MKAVPAMRTVIDTLVYYRTAFGTLGSYRSSEQKIEDEPNATRNKDGDKRPEGPIHAACSCIAVHVTDHEHEEGKKSRRHEGKQNSKELARLSRVTRPYDGQKVSWNPNEEYGRQNVRPAWNDRKLPLDPK